MLAALIVLAASIIVILYVVIEMYLDGRRITLDDPTSAFLAQLDEPVREYLGPMSVGTISQRMDVPRKYPLLRTRHSKFLP